MTTKSICYLIFALLIISSCSKKEEPEASTIDVSKQWSIDPLGNVISSTGDRQWLATTFTDQELNLFSSLDTADLSGTNPPAFVLETPPNYNPTYPNPFTTTHRLSLRFDNGYFGRIVFKCVVVDSTMTPHFKLVTRLFTTNASINITLNPTIPVGRFRLFYTLSTQSKPHFYKNWGNIQKTQ
jgi:hypothetical protein